MPSNVCVCVLVRLHVCVCTWMNAFVQYTNKHVHVTELLRMWCYFHYTSMGGPVIGLSSYFITSQHCYKLGLRLYLNGGGSGRGTHVSFIITLMKGEFDPLLLWPFKQTVFLSLLAQDGESQDITQSFKPDGGSSSFQIPKLEMTMVSGCLWFARISGCVCACVCMCACGEASVCVRVCERKFDPPYIVKRQNGMRNRIASPVLVMFSRCWSQGDYCTVVHNCHG